VTTANDVEERRRGEASRTTARVKTRALELGFSAVGITQLEANPHAAELDAWLAAGYAGRMTYLHRQATKRKDPRRIMPDARYAVVTLTNYFHESPDPAGTPPGTRSPRIAQYAWSTDYHSVIGPRLEQLAATIRAAAPDARTRCYVDAGPVPERELAQQAGLGWIAKNMMLISPRLGSFTFIGVVLTDAELVPDEPFATDHCGTCRRCLDACPTDAFVEPGLLDARRCISYVTIEHRGAFDATQRDLPGEWLFGCDVCQDVCPWNQRFAAPTTDASLAARAELAQPDPAVLGAGDAAEFARRFGDTPLARAGSAGMRRNVAAMRIRT
jgi:epoxyqueuosine reductase